MTMVSANTKLEDISMARLAGKVVIVTGAGSGIGRACFELFAAEGAKVVGVSRTKSKLDESMGAVEKSGGEGFVISADLAESSAMKEVVAATIERYGKVDVLIHAAGVGYNFNEFFPGSMDGALTLTESNWREVMRINLDACFFASSAVLPQMIKQGGGAIVNIASIFGTGGTADAHAYSTAKAGIINFTRSLCVAYAKDGIRANTMAPGFVDTPMIASMMHLFDDDAVASQLSTMGRAGTPIEIANGCLFLASDEASYCNGSTLTIDGGTTASVI